MRKFFLIPVLLLAAGTGIMAQGADMENTDQATVVIGGGCFWCVEAVYERIEGITSAVSGYAGGTVENPTYKQVTTGTTGHAEVVKLTFDPERISYREILDIFFTAHDPTTVNRQGADVGPQYRSIILYLDEAQRRTAEEARAAAAKNYEKPVVTQIVPLETFYEAEEYHQDYYDNNPFAGYCSYVIQPKLRKLGLEWRSIK
ncbi:peptide-methionine (S)-S-oxide reductase MsrA [Marispirochaeta sp.]|uniref:peptide-methionine (S)-S-oxide reductase MsrA n=1 Tax=Marispirochaeta sp. TaxID=2038653 RepID=UPI0029C89FEC|nr:peptide-methionine (S)-S-oxide reductase MsrA [Marispirochaeta sp.]